MGTPKIIGYDTKIYIGELKEEFHPVEPPTDGNFHAALEAVRGEIFKALRMPPLRVLTALELAGMAYARSILSLAIYHRLGVFKTISRET